MPTRNTEEAWMIPFYAVMWATLLCGMLMTIIILLKH